MQLDGLIEKVAAMGAPALVLYVLVTTSSLFGGAAMVSALACLGGPLGMVGGFFCLGFIGLIAQALARQLVEAYFRQKVADLHAGGRSSEEIAQQLEGLWISRSLRAALLAELPSRPAE